MLTFWVSSILSITVSKLSYMTIGERIKQARLAARLTQQQLANHVGVSRAAVTQWENGDTKGLKPQNLFACARILEVSAEWLGTGEGPEQVSEAMPLKESKHFPPSPTLTPITGSASEHAKDAFLHSSPAARRLAEEIIQSSAAGRIDDRVLDMLLQLVHELAGSPRTKQLKRMKDLPRDGG